MAKQITFEKVSSVTPDEIRKERGITQDKYAGTMFFGPSVGQSFSFYFNGKGVNDGGYYHTSPVKNVQYLDENTLVLETANSIYRLTINKEIEPT